jgi:hypothetical protein
LVLLAPHTNGPRDVPRCGGGSEFTVKVAPKGGFSRNRFDARRKFLGSGA